MLSPHQCRLARLPKSSPLTPNSPQESKPTKLRACYHRQIGSGLKAIAAWLDGSTSSGPPLPAALDWGGVPPVTEFLHGPYIHPQKLPAAPATAFLPIPGSVGVPTKLAPGAALAAATEKPPHAPPHRRCAKNCHTPPPKFCLAVPST